MTLPRQQFGINKFATSVSSCPVNQDAIKAIVIQRNNLAVVNGASTEMELVLSNFYSTINNAQKISLTLPAHGGTALPISLHKLNEAEENIKFLAILPDYGTVSNTSEFIEWTTIDSIDSGVLFNMPTNEPSASLSKSFNIDKINSIEFGWGSFISFTGGTGPMWIGSDGGLLKWDGTNMKIWSTFNGTSPSDYINSITVDTNSNLWIGSSKGLLYFNETTGFTSIFNTDNSSLLSEQVNDVKLLSVDKVVAGTDLGMSIYNFSLKTWESFDIYTTPELLYNKINKVAVKNSIVLTGTTGGVFVYDSSTLTWNASPFNSSNTAGWNAPDDVKCLAVFGTNIYAGTTGGLVIFSYLGGTAETIVSGTAGPVSSSMTSLRVVNYNGVDQLYVGHDDGISILDIGTNTWGFTANSSNYPTLIGVTDLLVDFRSGATVGKTIFIGNESLGLSKMFTTGPTFGAVPEANKSTNLLLKYPVDNSVLYSSLQPLYFLFSKSMTPLSFQQNVVLKDGLTTSICNTHGATVTGIWTWTVNNKLGKFTPINPLLEATPYNLSLLRGSTAEDSSYLKEYFAQSQFYTENLVPENGWLPIGKLMILSGTNDKYIRGLYLRNPHTFDVTLNILIGLI